MGDDTYALAGEPDRTSVLAILALICSLAICIPGLGVIGAVLGVAALVGIGASGGRVGGRGLAIGGIVVGVLISIAWVAAAIGINQFGGMISRFGNVVEYSIADDVPQARSTLTQAVSDEMSDDEIIAFGDTLEAEWGPYVGKPDDLIGYISAFSEFASNNSGGSQPALTSAQNAYGQSQAIIPVPLEFDNGTVLVAVIADQTSQQGSGLPSVRNAVAALPDGSVLWLLDPSRAPGLRQQPQQQQAPPSSQSQSGEDQSDQNNTDEGTTEPDQTGEGQPGGGQPGGGQSGGGQAVPPPLLMIVPGGF